jgi:putative transcriptional regulator
MKSLQGQLLIATPELLDPNFVHTVVLMVQHDHEGALGLILNRPTEMTVRSAWEQVSQAPCAIEGMIYQGGPCDGPLMVLHGHEDRSQIEVLEGVHFAAEPDMVEWLIGHADHPSRFVVNYAGWSPGQLESELKTDSWLLAPATPSLVFGETEDLWETLITIQRWAAVGVRSLKPRLMPTDPSLN